MNENTIALISSVGKRFLKGFVAGALASLAAISFNVPATWEELSTVLVAFAFAAVTGGISGGLLALEKWANWTP